MLHTKFQGHRFIGPGGKDFSRFCTIYGHDGHFGHVTQFICTNFRFHPPITLYEIWFQMTQQFLKKKETSFNFETRMTFDLDL